MALIKCPECHKKISNQCDRCPHCGYPVDTYTGEIVECTSASTKLKRVGGGILRKAKAHKITILVMVAIVAVVTILIVTGINNSQEAKDKKAAYQAAITQLEKGLYEEAMASFTKMGSYEDSQLYVNVCKFQLALAQEEQKNYTEAAVMYEELGDYVHRYADFESAPVAAADKATEMWNTAKTTLFQKIATDTIYETSSGLVDLYDWTWDISISNFDFTINEYERIVMSYHLYAYNDVYVYPKTKSFDTENTSVFFPNYRSEIEKLGEDYEQFKAEWLTFMEKNYKGKSKTIRD